MHSGRRWLILATVAACFLPVTADATILNVAVPSLTDTLDASARDVLWIADVYPLVMVGLVLVTGPLGDRIGHRRLLLIGLAVFGSASGLSALAQSPEALIAGRAALAVGASAIIPSTLAVIRQVFTDPKELGIAIGVWSAVAAGGAAVGPVVGGLLLEHYWWGSVFVVNVPVVAVLLAAVAVLMPRHTARTRTPWEPLSPLLAVVGVVGVVYGVKAFTHDGFALNAVLPTAVGLCAVALFVRRQLRLTHPMLDLAPFGQPRFRTGVMAATLPVLVLVGFELQLAQHLQFALDMSPREAGLFLLPLPVAAFAAGPAAGFLSARHGLATIIPAGLGLAALGYVGIAVTAGDGEPSFAMACCLVAVGAGHGAVQTVASEAIMTGAPADQAGGAAAVESVSYEVGAGFGIALIGSLTVLLYGRAFDVPGQDVPEDATDSIGEAMSAADDLAGAAGDAVAEAARQAFTDAYQVAAVVCAVVVAVVAVTVAVAWRRAPAPAAPADVRADDPARR
ncbi:MFS transporter [Streptomyces marincola]|uniref:MFS transporter n=1 Tax=Streptomyces marincola TaxID=2878388 RepID=UPI001CF31E43|nr:MFS transporter [Streptomyces marincola]UCM91039.1 MFS transporter [Streptomyces marincola]